MKRYEEIFLSLLRAGVWGTVPEIPSDFDDWKSVVRLAKSQSVLGIVGNVMLSNECISSVMPDDMRLKIRSFCVNVIGTHPKMTASLHTVVDTLHGNGIEPVLLKGEGLARNYPVPQLRQCGDIDIYVGTENYDKACRVLEDISTADAEEETHETIKHYSVKVGFATVEIHRFSDVQVTDTLDAIYRSYADKGLSSGLSCLDLGSLTVSLPSDNFNAFYIFNHLWRHFLKIGVGLRQLCDWMLFLHTHQETVDSDYLHGILTEMGLLESWQAFGCVLTGWLGMPEKEFPLYAQISDRKRDRILRRILNEGNFGQDRDVVRHREKGYLKAKANSLAGYISRYVTLATFAPRYVMLQFGNTLAVGFEAVWKDFRKRKKTDKI